MKNQIIKTITEFFVSVLSWKKAKPTVATAKCDICGHFYAEHKIGVHQDLCIDAQVWGGLDAVAEASRMAQKM